VASLSLCTLRTVSKALNILFLSSWFPGKHHRTLGNFVQRHAEAVATKHQVHVLHVVYTNTFEANYTIEDTEHLGVKMTHVYVRKKPFQPWRKFIGFKKGLAHLQAKNAFHFDVVHLNVIWSDGWQALYLKKFFQLPYIITEHWTGYNKTLRPNTPMRVKWLAKPVAAGAACICPVSEDLANSMRQFGLKGTYKVVPNVVDTDLFVLQEKPNQTLQFLHVSSLVDDQKNITGILKAWKEACSKRTNIHLTLGGDGPWEHWKEESTKLGIPEESISFFGELPWSGIAALMQQSHALLLFSRYENLPCVIVEALASGMQVVSSRVGGIAEHISNERGVLVTSENHEELVSALVHFNLADINPKALREYAVNHFSKPAIAHAFTEVYQQALTKK
jgi:glycosyltransferase involved in cell wall biosynthesis